jgi:hypothetical protein
VTTREELLRIFKVIGDDVLDQCPDSSGGLETDENQELSTPGLWLRL